MAQLWALTAASRVLTVEPRSTSPSPVTVKPQFQPKDFFNIQISVFPDWRILIGFKWTGKDGTGQTGLLYFDQPTQLI